MTTAEQRSEESPPTPAADGPPGPSGGNPQSYEVIARRYRPRFFREVVGQEAIAETLTQAIELGRLGHAYLFCGPRGVGKTSTAAALACAALGGKRPRAARTAPPAFPRPPTSRPPLRRRWATRPS